MFYIDINYVCMEFFVFSLVVFPFEPPPLGTQSVQRVKRNISNLFLPQMVSYFVPPLGLSSTSSRTKNEMVPPLFPFVSLSHSLLLFLFLEESLVWKVTNTFLSIHSSLDESNQTPTKHTAVPSSNRPNIRSSYKGTDSKGTRKHLKSNQGGWLGKSRYRVLFSLSSS